MQEKEKLEKTLDSNVITTFDMVNLLKFATQPKEITVEYRPSPINKKLSEIIVNGLSNLESLQLNEMRNVEHQVEWIGVPGLKYFAIFYRFFQLLSQLILTVFSC